MAILFLCLETIVFLFVLFFLRQVLQYGSDHMLRGEADEEHRAALFDLVFDSVE